MAKFTTRVELESANDEDYNALDAVMEQNGFTRTLASPDGKTYRLPTAEYNYDGDATALDVCNRARAAAAAAGKTNVLILVTEAVDRAWLLRAV